MVLYRRFSKLTLSYQAFKGLRSKWNGWILAATAIIVSSRGLDETADFVRHLRFCDFQIGDPKWLDLTSTLELSKILFFSVVSNKNTQILRVYLSKVHVFWKGRLFWHDWVKILWPSHNALTFLALQHNSDRNKDNLKMNDNNLEGMTIFQKECQ